MKSFKRLKRFVCLLLTCCLLLSTVTLNVAAGEVPDIEGTVTLTFRSEIGQPALQTVTVPFGTPFADVLMQIETPISEEPWDWFGRWYPETNNFSVVDYYTPLYFDAEWWILSGDAILFFEGNGGTPELQDVMYCGWTPSDTLLAEFFAQIEEPIKEGYTFLGWFTAPEGGTQLLPMHTIADANAANGLLFAQWEPSNKLIPINVLFETPAEMGQLQLFLLNNPGVRIPPNYLREQALVGHANFAEQLAPIIEANPDADIKITFSSTWHHNYVSMLVPARLVAEIAALPEVRRAGQFDLVTGWTSVPFWFISNDGTPAHQEFNVYHSVPRGVIYASIFAQIDEPTRQGYAFLGWFTAPEGGAQVLPENEVENYGWRQLYAQWGSDKLIPINVLFETPAEMGQLQLFLLNNPGVRIPPNYLREQALVGHANFAEQLAPIIEANPDAGIKITFSSTWHHNYVSMLVPARLVAEIAALPEVRRAGQFDLVTGWTSVPFWFISNDGTPAHQEFNVHHSVPRGVIYASIFAQIDEPTREGHTFLGWFTAPEGGVQVLPENEVGNYGWRQLYAQWGSEPQITLTFRSNIGEPALQTVTVTAGTPFTEVFAQIEIPTSEKPWYEFDRWYPEINLNSMVDCCTPLYFDAMWWNIVSDAALFFNGNGGTPEQQSLMYSGWTPNDMLIDWLLAQVAPPTREGYTFLGWFSLPDGGIQLLPTNTIGDVRREAATGDTLFAQWKAVPQAPTPPTLPPAPPSTTFPPLSPLPPLQPPVRRQPQQTETMETLVYAIAYEESDGALYTPSPPTSLPIPEQSEITLIFTSNSERYFYRGRWHAGIGMPFIDPITDRMMVPLRTIAEAIDVNVDWCSDTRTAVIYLPDGELRLPLDESLPNGMGIPVMVEDRVFVPLRFVMYALGADVEWDSENNTAVITIQ